MDLLTIEELLPNGFHDAYLSELTLDFIGREANILLDVLMANDNQPVGERYKKCRLTLHDCAVVLLEPAVAYREIKAPEGLEVDRTEFGEEDQKRIIEAGYRVPKENFWLALFVYEWNSRIVINARDGKLQFL